MLEIGIDALGIDCNAQLESNEVVTQVVGGNQLPLAQPGSNEPIRIPSTVLTFALTKQAALKYAELLKEQAELLPDEKSTSSILTASDLHAVEQMARMQKDLTKMK